MKSNERQALAVAAEFGRLMSSDLAIDPRCGAMLRRVGWTIGTIAEGKAQDVFEDAPEEQPAAELDGRVAVVPIQGVLMKRANILSDIFGWTTYDDLAETVAILSASREIDAIVYDVDSPGGQVAGVRDAADAIANAAANIPSVAIANDLAASAAQWLHAAAGTSLVTQTSTTGSIGVIRWHLDTSGAQQQAGEVETPIYSGEWKAIDWQPLTSSAKEHLQSKTDSIYGDFVADIARFRGVSEDQVRSQMADGRTFFGSQAVDVGLADGVSTLPEVVSQVAAEVGGMPSVGSPEAPAEITAGRTVRRQSIAASAGQKTRTQSIASRRVFGRRRS